MFRLQDKAMRLAARDSVVPKDARCVLEAHDGSACYLYERAGRHYAIAFSGTAGRPDLHYAYRNEERRAEAVQEWKAGQEHRHAYKAAERTKRAAWSNTAKVGDIFYTSWGYDQTNVSFYAVTAVSGRRVRVRQIAAEIEETGMMSGRTWPRMPIAFVGEETIHVAQPSGESVCLTIGGHHASLEKGTEHYVSWYA